MKKKQIANLVMVVAILVIAAAGVLAVGHLQGWFDQPQEGDAVLSRVVGIVNMERDGVAYGAEADTLLRAGDELTTTTAAKTTISVGNSYLVLNQNTTLSVTELTQNGFSAVVASGEVFVSADAAAQINLTFQGQEVALTDTAMLLSVRSGAESISVFYGSVTAGESTAQAQEMLSWVGDELTVQPFSIQSLNDFTLDQIRSANETATLCFTNEDLDLLEAERLAAMQALLNQTEPLATAEDTQPLETTQNETTRPVANGGQQVTEPPVTTAPVGNTVPSETTVPKETTPVSTDPQATEPAETAPVTTATPTESPESTQPPATEPPAEAKKTCTITIRCDTILNNWADLDPAKAGYVPSSGCILSTVTVEFEEGETVFDVLKRACDTFSIQLEYSWTPMYNSYYIEGINHLYEFDCGSESGWMYKVNGWFPNYGCSSYYLKDGDVIVWCYTCKGLGADVGG